VGILYADDYGRRAVKFPFCPDYFFGGQISGKKDDCKSRLGIYHIAFYVCCSYVSIIGSFVPIPGGSGGIEYSFLQFFGGFVTGAVLSATVILWRSITYYFAMILGGLLFTTFKGVKDK
jgi:hypothetical protein